jgi:hypothetical protein
MLLKEYVSFYIKEAMSHKKLISVANELNKITTNYRASSNSYSLYYDLVKVVDKFGLKKLGSGVSRKAYSLENEDWVLKFAYGHDDVDYLYALETNAEEVAISQGAHGIGSRDIFVQVYDWDKLSEKPAWIIAQKVITLSEACRTASFLDLQKIFPTFWNALHKDAKEKTSKSFFCDFVADSMFEMSMYIVTKEKNIAGLSRLGFYRAMKEGAIRDEDLVAFEEVYFGEDFSRIARACAYSRPDDMHSGNIGIIPTHDASPKDIVILDYMLDFGSDTYTV